MPVDHINRKAIEKAGLASFKMMEQDRITVLQQAEAQLQKAQDAFDTVQNQLGQLLKGLH